MTPRWQRYLSLSALLAAARESDPAARLDGPRVVAADGRTLGRVARPNGGGRGWYYRPIDRSETDSTPPHDASTPDASPRIGTRPMKMSSAFPSKYLAADADVPDFEDGGLVVTISGAKLERVGMGNDAADKPVLYFEEIDKGLVLNKTNANVLTDLFGTDDTDEWEGRKVRLYAKDVEYQGKMVRGIRVHTRPPKAPTEKEAAAAKVTSPPRAEDDKDDSIPF